jgi:Fur family peroxide stress response transcriptional regulator
MQELLAAFEDACKQAGLRLTFQRMEIFRELAMATDHPSAETLHKRLRKKIPTISLDTIYRTLTTFAQHGLVHKVDTVESQARFEVKRILHHHLICSRCKKIMDFSWQAIDEAPLPRTVEKWGRIDNKSVVVYGVCSDCLG